MKQVEQRIPGFAQLSKILLIQVKARGGEGVHHKEDPMNVQIPVEHGPQGAHHVVPRNFPDAVLPNGWTAQFLEMVPGVLFHLFEVDHVRLDVRLFVPVDLQLVQESAVFKFYTIYFLLLIPVIGFILYNLIFSSCAARHSGVIVRGGVGPT